MPWLAHLYTGLGAPVALAATLAVIGSDYRGAFIWLGVQMFIDATDGLLARALHVKTRLPQFDGARLDDIIDYICYVFVPVLLLLHSGLLSGTSGLVVASAMLLASAYGFSQSAAKIETTDYFFTGFPSYWSLVALYLYWWQWSPATNAIALSIFVVLVFVPIRYVYPSRTTEFSTLTNLLGAAWAVLTMWLVWLLPARDLTLVAVSLLFPIYYFLLSLWLDWRSRGHRGVGDTAG